jgi:arginyl-tRNA synthetase
MEQVQDAVVDALNELYDPLMIAKGNVQAKINKLLQQKKSKKKGVENGEESPTLSLAEQEMMMNDALANAPKEFGRSDAMVTVATKSEFGDYQINAAMGLSKALGISPRDCAAQIVESLCQRPWIQQYFVTPMQIAGPGFINLEYKTSYLQNAVRTMAADIEGRLALPPCEHPQRIVVDYSSPNIAKEMHVGHLRSTIIGDTIANVLQFVGHDVVRLNHIGDWGTQFGMLVEHLRDEYPQALVPRTKDGDDVLDLGDLVVLYKAAKKRFDADEAFKERARQGVVKLQAGDPESIAAWESLCEASRVEYQKIYDMLNIHHGLTERGESFYNPFLADVISELQTQGLAQESEGGALVVYLEGYSNRDGTLLPVIIRKSDGGYNYATTDLAAIRHRTLLPRSIGKPIGDHSTGIEANRVLYVTDAGQAQHFEMVFEVAKKAGFLPAGTATSLEHVPFGLVQGEDGKKFATRSGETVKLKDLLNEAIRIAGDDLRARSTDQATDDEFAARVDRVARIVGIGAVKYADLSMNRESNYRFSYDRMLSLNGNTAPYMMYAYARICGIVRKATNDSNTEAPVVWPTVANEVFITHESERDLIRTIVRLPDVLLEVERDLYPNKICDYLFETSQKFNQFYENCSVNNAESAELKTSRLTLCAVTAGTIRLLLTLLGIETVEKL